jgi:protein-S-isoprenylcysteine O-methyltransferase Ste14
MREVAVTSEVSTLRIALRFTMAVTAMSAGLIILFYSIPVALGSLWTLIPASVLTLLFVIRTHFEDKTLHEELEGYKAYSGKVKYRLLPGIW